MHAPVWVGPLSAYNGAVFLAAVAGIGSAGCTAAAGPAGGIHGQSWVCSARAAGKNAGRL